ncbi:hypothetical protein GCM10018787_37710 [Streptomyces thermodiastaticus]|nr:hypothetical protein GCM10018787_37710 [Streptomyces thermodiastaticus]
MATTAGVGRRHPSASPPLPADAPGADDRSDAAGGPRPSAGAAGSEAEHVHDTAVRTGPIGSRTRAGTLVNV